MTAEQPQAQHGLAEIVGGLATDVQEMVRGEIALARVEMDRKLRQAMMAVVWLAGGALVGFAGLVVVLQGAAAALALVMPVWAACLIVGLVIVVLGVLFARSGLASLSLQTLVPDRAVASLTQDARMMKEHL